MDEPTPIAKVTWLSAAVLAGGASSRMGQNKALLPLQGVPLIQRVVETLRQVSDDVMVSTSAPALYSFLAGNVRFVPDREGPGRGPLVGIASVLTAANHPHVLVVGTDMPFLQVGLLRYLATVDLVADVVTPVLSDDAVEPLHSVYHTRILPCIEEQLSTGENKIATLFERVTVRKVLVAEIQPFDAMLLSLFNVNTLQDWARAEQIAAELR